jgi:hypothetical protein
MESGRTESYLAGVADAAVDAAVAPTAVEEAAGVGEGDSADEITAVGVTPAADAEPVDGKPAAEKRTQVRPGQAVEEGGMHSKFD